MHCAELVDLASILALSGHQLIVDGPLVDDAMSTYWSASRCRLDRWGRGLHQQQNDETETEQSNSFLCELFEEVLASEIFTRVAAAAFVAHDEERDRNDAGVIGRNILHGHVDVRRRALARIAACRTTQPVWIKENRHLYRRCRKWNDLLIGRFMTTSTAAVEFAFDAARAADFAHESRAPESTADAMFQASLRVAFRPLAERPAFSDDLNFQIAAAVIACFGPELFDSFGLLKSTWLHRMQLTTDETIAMVDDLLAPAPPGPAVGCADCAG